MFVRDLFSFFFSIYCSAQNDSICKWEPADEKYSFLPLCDSTSPQCDCLIPASNKIAEKQIPVMTMAGMIAKHVVDFQNDAASSHKLESGQIENADYKKVREELLKYVEKIDELHELFSYFHKNYAEELGKFKEKNTFFDFQFLILHAIVKEELQKLQELKNSIFREGEAKNHEDLEKIIFEAIETYFKGVYRKINEKTVFIHAYETKLGCLKKMFTATFTKFENTYDYLKVKNEKIPGASEVFLGFCAPEQAPNEDLFYLNVDIFKLVHRLKAISKILNQISEYFEDNSSEKKKIDGIKQTAFYKSISADKVDLKIFKNNLEFLKFFNTNLMSDGRVELFEKELKKGVSKCEAGRNYASNSAEEVKNKTIKLNTKHWECINKKDFKYSKTEMKYFLLEYEKIIDDKFELMRKKNVVALELINEDVFILFNDDDLLLEFIDAVSAEYADNRLAGCSREFISDFLANKMKISNFNDEIRKSMDKIKLKLDYKGLRDHDDNSKTEKKENYEKDFME